MRFCLELILAAAFLGNLAAAKPAAARRRAAPRRVGGEGGHAQRKAGADFGGAEAGALVPTPDVRGLVAEAAKNFDVNPLLVDSVIQVESNYNPFAVSPKGAQGLMQLMPATAQRFGVTDSFDPKQNIEAGVRYLKFLQDTFQDDRLAIAAYNAGEKAVAKYKDVPPYPETVSYVAKVGKKYGQAKRAAVKSNETDTKARSKECRGAKAIVKTRRGTFLRMWIQRASYTSQLDRKSMLHLPRNMHGRIARVPPRAGGVREACCAVALGRARHGGRGGPCGAASRHRGSLLVARRRNAHRHRDGRRFSGEVGSFGQSRPLVLRSDRHQAHAGPQIHDVIPVSDHFVRQIRVAEPQHNITRVVLDLETSVEPTTSRLDNPTRLIIELRASGSAPETTKAPVKAPPTLIEPAPAPKPAERRPFTPPATAAGCHPGGAGRNRLRLSRLPSCT